MKDSKFIKELKKYKYKGNDWQSPTGSKEIAFLMRQNKMPAYTCKNCDKDFCKSRNDIKFDGNCDYHSSGFLNYTWRNFIRSGSLYYYIGLIFFAAIFIVLAINNDFVESNMWVCPLYFFSLVLFNLI